jgi:hypothetical protein
MRAVDHVPGMAQIDLARMPALPASGLVIEGVRE